MADVTMYPVNICIHYIDIAFTPKLDDLKKEDLYLTLNDTYFNDFNLVTLNIDRSLYRITPYNFFNVQDEVRIQVNKSPYAINALRIYLSKYFYNDGGIFLYYIPKIPSGVYKTEIKSINDMELIISSDPITICNGINSISSIVTDKTIYKLGEDINVSVDLFDNDKLKAPNGAYVIKVAIEQLD